MTFCDLLTFRTILETRLLHYYRAMLAQSAVMRLHVVGPSVCLSARLQRLGTVII